MMFWVLGKTSHFGAPPNHLGSSRVHPQKLPSGQGQRCGCCHHFLWRKSWWFSWVNIVIQLLIMMEVTWPMRCLVSNGREISFESYLFGVASQRIRGLLAPIVLGKIGTPIRPPRRLGPLRFPAQRPDPGRTQHFAAPGAAYHRQASRAQQSAFRTTRRRCQQERLRFPPRALSRWGCRGSRRACFGVDITGAAFDCQSPLCPTAGSISVS